MIYRRLVDVPFCSKLLFAVLLMMPHGLRAQNAEIDLPTGWEGDAPVLSSLVNFARSESNLRVAVKRYVEDKASIKRRYEVLYSPARNQRLNTFHRAWLQRLEELDFDALNHEGQIDYIALRNRVEYDLETLHLAERQAKEMVPLLPFGDQLRLLQEDRHDRKRVDPQTAATTLDEVAQQVTGLTRALVAEAREAGGLVTRSGISPAIAWRAARQIEHLRTVLADFNTFYDGYDPIYSWWVREPYGRVDAALQDYVGAIDAHLVNIKPGGKAPIIGDPVLADGLRVELDVQMIPYTPEELIAIGQREFDWIENQFRIVSREMGYGDDWKAALEYAKSLAPPPGEKPWLIFEIQEYSEDFVAKLDMITLPPLPREVWRLAMQTPERQIINPFFTGGEVTRVSYPTDGMAHQDKLMSKRGNSPHLNFGSVQHELVPGHYMQGFLTRRFNPHRGELLRTPFWGEGWAQYWEFQLLSRDFPRNNPDKVGMLFWRLHRASRIIFSLNYQLGNWTPKQAVDFLVERGGHERANAEAEVRRSAMVSPLYQAGYMIGALQFRSLYQELVESGRMSATAFHDAIMLGGRLPIELVRARLTNQPLIRNYRSQWRFYSLP